MQQHITVSWKNPYVTPFNSGSGLDARYFTAVLTSNMTVIV
jgi:hypothetical protein